jgi:hypothetical protein
LYPGGFALAPDSQISSFTPATPILDLPEGTVWLAGGGLDAQSSFNLLARNRVTALGPGKLSLSFSGSNGTFKGALTPEGSPKASFRGVVLQNQGIGRGYFLNEGQSGEAVIGN